MYQKANGDGFILFLFFLAFEEKNQLRNVMVLVVVCAQRAGPSAAHLMGQQGGQKGEEVRRPDASMASRSAVETHGNPPYLKHTYTHQTYRYRLRDNMAASNKNARSFTRSYR